MNIKTIFLIVGLLLPSCTFCSIEGAYRVRGYDPESDERYRAKVFIEKQGEVFMANWTFDDGTTAVGTGVLRDKGIAFVFQESGSTSGVQFYEIKADILQGPWARLGASNKGFEKIVKIQE